MAGQSFTRSGNVRLGADRLGRHGKERLVGDDQVMARPGSTDIVERVAHAMATKFAATALPSLIRHGGLDAEEVRRSFIEIARVGIAELRVPAEAMLDAARERDGCTVYDDNADAADHWEAMIDAALSPP